MLYTDRTTCTGCAVCVDACPTGAISLDESKDVAAIDQALCSECLVCLDVCPNGAIQRAESSELVPAGAGEIVEGQVIESQVMLAPASGLLVATRQPSRLATLAGTALTLVRNWPPAARCRCAGRHDRASPGPEDEFNSLGHSSLPQGQTSVETDG